MSEIKVDIENGKSFSIDELTDSSAKVNGKQLQFDSIKLKEGKFNIVKDNTSFNAEVVEFDADSKSFSIKVNTNIYKTKVEDQFDILLKKLGMDSLVVAGVTELKAPMPGLVLNVQVAVGQEVAKDDPLIVLEAMKMENVLKSPADLVVKSIQVEQGKAVEKNQVLIEFE